MTGAQRIISIMMYVVIVFLGNPVTAMNSRADNCEQCSDNLERQVTFRRD